MSRPTEKADRPRTAPAFLPDECPACGHVAAARDVWFPQPYPEADLPAKVCLKCGTVRLVLEK